MECCDWQTFKQGFLTTLAENSVPSTLADWKRARRDWKRYACTGHESALMLVRRLREEGEYVHMQPNARIQRRAQRVRWNELLGGGARTLRTPLNEATPPTP